MIHMCKFCDFKREKELSHPILKVLASEDLPQEDYILWGKRLFKVAGFKEHNGVKVHMGRMHKEETYYQIMPDTMFSDSEVEILNEVKNGTRASNKNNARNTGQLRY